MMHWRKGCRGGVCVVPERLLQWPRERFDAVLEALRAAQAVDLEALTEPTGDAQATQDSYQVHGQCYGRLRWRA